MTIIKTATRLRRGESPAVVHATILSFGLCNADYSERIKGKRSPLRRANFRKRKGSLSGKRSRNLSPKLSVRMAWSISSGICIKLQS